MEERNLHQEVLVEIAVAVGIGATVVVQAAEERAASIGVVRRHRLLLLVLDHRHAVRRVLGRDQGRDPAHPVDVEAATMDTAAVRGVRVPQCRLCITLLPPVITRTNCRRMCAIR